MNSQTELCVRGFSPGTTSFLLQSKNQALETLAESVRANGVTMSYEGLVSRPEALKVWACCPARLWNGTIVYQVMCVLCSGVLVWLYEILCMFLLRLEELVRKSIGNLKFYQWMVRHKHYESHHWSFNAHQGALMRFFADTSDMREKEIKVNK